MHLISLIILYQKLPSIYFELRLTYLFLYFFFTDSTRSWTFLEKFIALSISVVMCWMSSLSMIPEHQINTWREIKFNNNITSTSSFTLIHSHWQLWMNEKIVKNICTGICIYLYIYQFLWTSGICLCCSEPCFVDIQLSWLCWHSDQE